MNFSDYDFIIQPGWQNSGPLHWQSQWQPQLLARRVQHQNPVLWDEPELNAWLDALHQQIIASDKPVVIIAHSLGCITLAHYAQRYGQPEVSRIHGALLVAPADVERAQAPLQLHSFRPIPQRALPFPSRIIASTDDPYCEHQRAEQFARWWGGALISLGSAGHINVDSGYTQWEAGLNQLQTLLNDIDNI